MSKNTPENTERTADKVVGCSDLLARYNYEVDQIKADELLDAMYSLLKQNIFWTADRDCFDRQGYSVFIDEETAIRDVNYRKMPLCETAEEALDNAIILEIFDKRNSNFIKANAKGLPPEE